MKFSSELNKKAWAIRKASAKDLNVPIKEISWKVCLEMAKNGEAYKKQEIKYFHPDMKLRNQISEEFRDQVNIEDIIILLGKSNLNSGEKYFFNVIPKRTEEFNEETNKWEKEDFTLSEVEESKWFVLLTKKGKVKKGSLKHAYISY